MKRESGQAVPSRSQSPTTAPSDSRCAEDLGAGAFCRCWAATEEQDTLPPRQVRAGEQGWGAVAQWQAWPHATGDSTDQGQLVASPPNPPPPGLSLWDLYIQNPQEGYLEKCSPACRLT